MISPDRVLSLIDEATQSRLRELRDYVLEANQTLNLTAVRESEAAWNKHILDSLHGLASGLFEEEARVLDIGSGAGFPGLVLAMARPQLQVFLLDATRKKCDFLEKAAAYFGLNVRVLNGRAEEVGQEKQWRASFNVVTARAVGSLSEVCELGFPMARVGGHLLLWRGQDAAAEIEKSRPAVRQLGGASTHELRAYTLPAHAMTYHLLTLSKTASTPARFPRRNGLPKNAPL